MKYFFILSFLISALQSQATTKILMDSIGYGKLLQIDGRISLPKGQKLNQAAPNQIEVFEKEGKNWVLTEKVELRDFFAFSEIFNFYKPIKLRSESSNIKIKAELFHCARSGHGTCVIEAFEGAINRAPAKTTSEVHISLKGTMPY
jgi:hypothetical protein